MNAEQASKRLTQEPSLRRQPSNIAFKFVPILILNPAHSGVLARLQRLAKQTHLHVVLIGPENELLNVYEFENTFGLKTLIPISESACKTHAGMDFIAAKREYDQTYTLMELFHMNEPVPEAEAEADDQGEPEENFLIPESSRALIDGAVWLAGQLLTRRD